MSFGFVIHIFSFHGYSMFIIHSLVLFNSNSNLYYYLLHTILLVRKLWVSSFKPSCSFILFFILTRILIYTGKFHSRACIYALPIITFNTIFLQFYTINRNNCRRNWYFYYYNYFIFFSFVSSFNSSLNLFFRSLIFYTAYQVCLHPFFINVFYERFS